MGIQLVSGGSSPTPKLTSILDSNGNELFKFTATGSAVNEITLANAAAGGSPTIAATGDDTNVGIKFLNKGTGVFEFQAVAQASAAETIMRWTVADDANKKLEVLNASATDGVFQPELRGTSNSGPALVVGARTSADSSTTECLRFDISNSSGAALTTRPMAAFRSGGSIKILISATGKIGWTSSVPTAWMHLPAGSTSADSAPLKFTNGTNMTTPEVGAMEFTSSRLLFTDGDAVRRHVVQAVSATKTTAGAPYTNDGYAEIVINGTTLKVMTTA